ncbi:limbic system-associated membrane protein-like [Paramacrobiotus metropolitanus]|uniref:limbic system-associated membrane protein-like n=1 Tax=Paramacrobiotus metropolitanus TaxID=2943436 RepID=UPI002445BF38|nr:limbic system-associated membrane protein-like [Paramacrobiotus metropolitanus]
MAGVSAISAGVLLGLLLTQAVMCEEIPAANPAPEGADTPSSEETSEAALPPATIATQGQLLNVKVGDRLELPCEVENVDSGVVVWRKGAKALSNGPRIFSRSGHLKIEVKGRNYNLVISKARTDDKGQYTCLVEQENAVNITHTVTVTYPPTVDVQPLQDSTEIPKGDSFSVSCITTGEPEPSVTWKLKDELGNSRELPDFAGMRNITVEQLSRADAGEYHCVADNGVGEAVSSSVKIVVTFPPEVSETKSLFLTKVGGDASLQCVFSAYPPGEVQANWYRMDKAVDDAASADGFSKVEVGADERHAIQTDAQGSTITTTLTVRNVEETDLKKYECAIRNDKGAAEHKLELSAHAHPEKVHPAERHKEPQVYGVKMRVKSISPVKQYRIIYREINETHEGDAKEELLAGDEKDVVETENGVKVYERVYIIKNLRPLANYTIKMAAQNDYGWSRDTDMHRFSMEDPTKSAASGLQGGPTGSSMIFCRSNLLLLSNVLLCWLLAHAATHWPARLA